VILTEDIITGIHMGAPTGVDMITAFISTGDTLADPIISISSIMIGDVTIIIIVAEDKLCG
jgi:hypothetical protein